jgi:hypothetical protein
VRPVASHVCRPQGNPNPYSLIRIRNAFAKLGYPNAAELQAWLQKNAF